MIRGQRIGVAVACLALFAALLVTAHAAHAASANNGKVVFGRCAMCHTVVKNGPNSIGPNLFGIIGRKAGSRPGFTYSTAMTASGITWTPGKLDGYITHPAQVGPGTRMAFAGISDATQRADLIAYLQTLK